MSLRKYIVLILAALLPVIAWAGDKDFPDKPNPPRLVNDLAHVLTDEQAAQLEQKLQEFDRTTSNEITIVTITNLGDYDVADYALQLGNKWGVGKQGKYNGVMVLAAIENHKINISPAKGLEGALPDITCGQIIRNEITPAFRQGDYYTGFSKAADAIMAATKGEYKPDDSDKRGHFSLLALVLFITGIYFILWLISKFRGGGGGGGSYMSGRGFGGFYGGGFGGFGGGSGGGGGFGGFGGGGGFSGGGASGGW